MIANGFILSIQGFVDLTAVLVRLVLFKFNFSYARQHLQPFYKCRGLSYWMSRCSIIDCRHGSMGPWLFVRTGIVVCGAHLPRGTTRDRTPPCHFVSAPFKEMITSMQAVSMHREEYLAVVSLVLGHCG